MSTLKISYIIHLQYFPSRYTTLSFTCVRSFLFSPVITYHSAFSAVVIQPCFGTIKVPRIIWHTALYVQRIREIIFFTLHNRNFFLILIIFPDPEMIGFLLKTLGIQLFHKIFPVHDQYGKSSEYFLIIFVLYIDRIK